MGTERMSAIYKRELRSYFFSPLGYIFIAIFLAASGVMFSMYTLQAAGNGNNMDLGMYFTMVIMMFIVILPLITMKSFSEERKLKTEQLLLTAPVSLRSMVLAKFLAAYTVFTATTLLSCIYFIVIDLYGTPNNAVLFGTVIGILLIGGAFIAVGLFISSLTENQLIAAIGTMAILLFMIIIGFFNDYISFAPVRFVLDWISIYSRFRNFTYGIFDFAAIVYYASIIFAFLFLTVRVYEKRRWE